MIIIVRDVQVDKECSLLLWAIEIVSVNVSGCTSERVPFACDSLFLVEVQEEYKLEESLLADYDNFSLFVLLIQ